MTGINDFLKCIPSSTPWTAAAGFAGSALLSVAIPFVSTSEQRPSSYIVHALSAGFLGASGVLIHDLVATVFRYRAKSPNHQLNIFQQNVANLTGWFGQITVEIATGIKINNFFTVVILLIMKVAVSIDGSYGSPPVFPSLLYPALFIVVEVKT